MPGAITAPPSHTRPHGAGTAPPQIISSHWPQRERLLCEADYAAIIARVKKPYLERVDQLGIAHCSMLLRNWLLPLAGCLYRFRCPREGKAVIGIACNLPAVGQAMGQLLQSLLEHGFYCAAETIHLPDSDDAQMTRGQNLDAVIAFRNYGDQHSGSANSGTGYASPDVVLYLDQQQQICGVSLCPGVNDIPG